MPAGKRTRFGLVFQGAQPPSMGGDFLKDLDVIKAEGCEKEGRQFLIFTTNRPRRSDDVLESLRAYNAQASEKVEPVSFENGPLVAVFERGNCFRTHAISKIIQGAMEGDDGYWVWSVMMDGDRKKKRAVNELESDLVETSIRPSASKRVAGVRAEETGIDADPATQSKKKKSTSLGHKKFLGQKENVFPFGGDKLAVSKDMVVMFVKEITRSKDETIQTKNQMIELLMSRKCASCSSSAMAD